jgi:hypothetical protein
MIFPLNKNIYKKNGSADQKKNDDHNLPNDRQASSITAGSVH